MFMLEGKRVLLLKLRDKLLKIPENEKTAILSPIRLIHVVTVMLRKDESANQKIPIS